MRVLHLPTSVGNHSWCLSRGERELGLKSDVLVMEGSYLSYPSDYHVGLDGLRNTSARWWRLLKIFVEIRNKYDIFHFNWGSTLFTMRSLNLHHLELPFYPEESGLFVTYNGCDARQKYPTLSKGEGFSACKYCSVEDCDSGELDRSRAKGIRKFEKKANFIWGLNPDIMDFLPDKNADFIPYAVALNLDRPPVPPSYKGGRSLRVGHAPTNRDIKGTKFLISAVEKINKNRPGSIELIMVEGVAHAAALNIYSQVDIIVDQLLIGWYGTLAVEAMLLGKPVIARIDSKDVERVPSRMREELQDCIINANPETIAATLLDILGSPDDLRRRGAASIEYAHKWHAPRYVAGLTLEKYQMAKKFL